MTKIGQRSADTVVVPPASPPASNEKLRVLGHVEAVRRSVNSAKQTKLSAMLEASEAEGGAYTTENARRHVRKHLARLRQTSR